MGSNQVFLHGQTIEEYHAELVKAVQDYHAAPIHPEDIELYKKAIAKYGMGAQLMMFIEECGEALTAMSHWQRNRAKISALAEELADLDIMIDQLRMLPQVDVMFRSFRIAKLKRLEERMQ